jgi:hypothetical protein
VAVAHDEQLDAHERPQVAHPTTDCAAAWDIPPLPPPVVDAGIFCTGAGMSAGVMRAGAVAEGTCDDTETA